MDSSVDDKNISQKFFRVRNRVERFFGDCLLNITRVSLPVGEGEGEGNIFNWIEDDLGQKRSLLQVQ